MTYISKALKATIIVAILSGCVSAPTWTDNGIGELVTSSGRIVCYTDANIIDGERMEGTICATHESNFFGGGEPEIKFGPWGKKFMSALASETTEGISRDYNEKTVLLKCTPIMSTDQKYETGRDCTVTINQQHMVTAKITFGPKQ